MDKLSTMQAAFYGPSSLDNTSIGTSAPLLDNQSMAKDAAVSRFYEDFRTRLVAIRIAMGYSQEEFSTLLELPLATYCKYETRSKFPLHALPRLATLTQESIDALVTGRNLRILRARAVR
jgi:DNA-binding transcriptional regulator YiaG